MVILKVCTASFECLLLACILVPTIHVLVWLTIRVLVWLDFFTLCILEIPKQVLWQTVKTLMKCSIMLHFIKDCTVR